MRIGIKQNGIRHMTMTSAPARKASHKSRYGAVIIAGLCIVLLIAMALDTTVVRIGSSQDARKAGFSPAAYGKEEFPKVQAAVEKRAVDAVTLAAAIQKDQSAAAKQYGVDATMGPEMSVKFTGVVGKGESGVYDVKIPNLPDGIRVRVQTGPAVNGTDLRDAIGTIKFGQFKNQIEYQNAGAALNDELKKEVLSKVDTSKLTGKTISVVGAFLLINPKNWFVTPVKLSVEK